MPANLKTDKEISVHFVKSAQYREIYADGIWGGGTPHGMIHIVFFNTRWPTPKVTVHEVKDGAPDKELMDRREGLDGIVRHLEAGVYLNLQDAMVFQQWLGRKIEDLLVQMKRSEKGEAG